MKKILPALLALLLTFSFVGCGGDGDNVSESPQTQHVTTTENASTQDEEPTSESDNVSGQTSESENEPEQAKILVAYFSATGNTRPIAEAVAELTGGDLFEIIPAEPYSDDDLNYGDDNCRANREQNDSAARPEISGTIDNINEYDIVFLGHPIWWGEEPRIMDTFVESYDLSGKTVVNFCTSGGSGISTATANLKALSPNANWMDGHRFETGADSEAVQTWLNELNILN